MSISAGQRLLQLAGITGTAGALLRSIGTGLTAGALLVSRSTLVTATAAAHLLDAGAAPAPAPSGGSWVDGSPRRRRDENDEALLLFVLN